MSVEPEGVKCLTLWPEWIYAVLHLGRRVDNRDWRPPQSLRRLVLHGAQKIGGGLSNEPMACVANVMKAASFAGHRWGGKTYEELAPVEQQALCRLAMHESLTRYAGKLVCVVPIEAIEQPITRRHGWRMPGYFGWKFGEPLVLNEDDLSRDLKASGRQKLWWPTEEALQKRLAARLEVVRLGAERAATRPKQRSKPGVRP